LTANAPTSASSPSSPSAHRVKDARAPKLTTPLPGKHTKSPEPYRLRPPPIDKWAYRQLITIPYRLQDPYQRQHGRGSYHQKQPYHPPASLYEWYVDAHQLIVSWCPISLNLVNYVVSVDFRTNIGSYVLPYDVLPTLLPYQTHN